MFRIVDFFVLISCKYMSNLFKIAHYSTKVTKKNDLQPFCTKVYDFLTVKLPNRLQHLLPGISGTELDGWQADTTGRKAAEDVYHVNARGGGGIQKTVHCTQIRKERQKTTFCHKNLEVSGIMPIFAAWMRVVYRRDSIKLHNRSFYTKPLVEYLRL